MLVDHLGVFVGIDVSKATVDVCTYPHGEFRQFSNDGPGLRACLDWLAEDDVRLVTMEATGRLHDLAERMTMAAGLAVAVVNPGRVRSFARAKGRLAKTDRTDALVLAEYGAVMKPRPREPRDEHVEALETLVVRRRQLVTVQATERNRLACLPDCRRDEIIEAGFEAVLGELHRQIKAINRRIDDLIANDETLCTTDRIMRSMPGVGDVLSQAILSGLPEIGRLTRKQVVGLVGVAPINRDSGAARGRRAIHGGRGRIRNVLYMATITAIRHNPRIAAFYKSLRDAGKPPKVAITACMRKIIVTLNAMVRDNRPWTMSVEGESNQVVSQG